MFFNNLHNQLCSSFKNEIPTSNILKGNFDEVSLSLPGLVMYCVPDDFVKPTYDMRTGIGYVFCIAAAGEDVTDVFMKSVSLAERVESLLLAHQNVMNVLPSQPIANLDYKGGVIVPFTFMYITEAYYAKN